jgi:integrase
MGLIKRGSKWYVRLRQNGSDIWRATGTTNRKLAEQREAQLKLEMAQGRFGLKDEGNKRTFRDMADKYMTEYAVKKAPKSMLRDTISLKHLLPVLGDKYLSQITSAQITNYKTMRRNEGASASSINKELAFAKHAFNIAIREWEWVRDNPFSRVTMEKLPQQRVRYLTREEFDRLYQACNNRLKPIVLFAVNTGVRQDNILSLTWKQVDLSRNLILLEHTKNGERLGLPMNNTVKELLTELNKVRHINGDYVFSSTVGTKIDASKVDKWFRQALKASGITDFRFHDLRHTFASWLSQGDVNIYKVQRLLGHRTIAMTMRYAHLSPQNLQDSVAVLDKPNDVVAKTVAEQG